MGCLGGEGFCEGCLYDFGSIWGLYGHGRPNLIGGFGRNLECEAFKNRTINLRHFNLIDFVTHWKLYFFVFEMSAYYSRRSMVHTILVYNIECEI